MTFAPSAGGGEGWAGAEEQPEQEEQDKMKKMQQKVDAMESQLRNLKDVVVLLMREASDKQEMAEVLKAIQMAFQ